MLYKKTLALLCLAVGLAMFVAWNESKMPLAVGDSSGRIIPGIDNKTSIREFTIVSNAGSKLHLQRQGGGNWTIVTLPSQPASRAAVDFWLNLFTKPPARKVFTADRRRLVEYGLAPPAGSAEIVTDTRRHNLTIGALDTMQTGVYAIVDTPTDSETIVIRLLPVEFYHVIRRPRSQWTN
jgi:hypothetical protein